MYEIEHRAILAEKDYNILKERLERESVVLGSDDKEVVYYIFSNKLLKVVRNISKGTGKLSLKLNSLGAGSSFQEFEIEFPEGSFETMKTICSAISVPEQIISGTQKRTNYRYQDVEIALKWSEDWGYHVEFEMMISDLEEKDSTDKHIKEVAESLSVLLMTEEEVALFAAEVKRKNKKRTT